MQLLPATLPIRKEAGSASGSLVLCAEAGEG